MHVFIAPDDRIDDRRKYAENLQKFDHDMYPVGLEIVIACKMVIYVHSKNNEYVKYFMEHAGLTEADRIP